MITEAARRAMQKGQEKLDPLFAGKKRPTLEQMVDVWLDPDHVENRTDGSVESARWRARRVTRGRRFSK